jgi:phenylpropionate dioxygenase-like ring-hydroxylating dioxygenase large terminal subunit
MSSVDPRRDELADVTTPLLHDHWYVAGFADEFDEGLHERTLLDRSILIYRTESGDLAALQNRCAHRSFPLAHGAREGDEIRCRYHGAKYNAHGEMVEFPSIPKCPRISVRRYPMHIAGPLAWIWMGDPAAADVSRIPETPFLDRSQGWNYVSGHYELGGSWLLMAENLMDLTHIPFLHETTFKIPRGYAEASIKLEIDGDRLSYSRTNLPGYQRTGFLRPDISDAIERAGFQPRSAVNFVSPALTYGGGRFVLDKPAPEDQPVYEWQVVHFMTPISRDRTHYWYFFARNYALQDRELDEKINGMITAGFEEDRYAIELVQAMHETDRHAYREVHFKSDAPGVAMRRIVAGMARREQAASADQSGFSRA